jgi:hypothetical protein
MVDRAHHDPVDVVASGQATVVFVDRWCTTECRPRFLANVAIDIANCRHVAVCQRLIGDNCALISHADTATAETPGERVSRECRIMRDRQRQAVSKRWFVDQCHALMSYWDFL